MRLKSTKFDAERGEKRNTVRLSQRRWDRNEIGMWKREELLKKLCVLSLRPCVCARNDVPVGPAVSVHVFALKHTVLETSPL